MRLNDPDVVAREYASEDGLAARRAIYHAGGAHGPDTNEVLVDLLLAGSHAAVLEVGCGPGLLAERLRLEHGVLVKALDISERMVELARERGVEAVAGDVQSLPFEDESFDAVLAAWMLYHVPDIDLGVREIWRVLRPGGRLLAVTNGADHLRELSELIGIEGGFTRTFSGENGTEILGRSFAGVVVHDVRGTVTFPDSDAVRAYVSSLILYKHLAGKVPDSGQPFRANRHNAIFVATK